MKLLIESCWHLKPLHRLCAENYVVALPAIIEAAESVSDILESHDANGWTPLHVAVFLNHMQCAKILLKFGADPFATTVHGSSAFHIASSRGHQLMIKLLISNGCMITKELPSA